MAGALCTEMKQGQVRTRAVIKSRAAGEARSWCGARAPRCSAPRPGLWAVLNQLWGPAGGGEGFWCPEVPGLSAVP